jgi:hypothetical protein
MLVRSQRPFPSRTTLRVILAGVVVAALLVTGPAARAASAAHSWSMDEPEGTGTMFDSGSPQTNGTWLDIQAGVPGFAGTAYRFDGSSRVTIADNPSLNPGSDTFAATVRVKFTVMPTDAVGDYDLIRKGLASTQGGYWKVEIYPNSSNTKAQGLCQMKGSSDAIKIVGSPTSLNDGTWHTITCTKTSSSVTLTVDGTSYSETVTIGSIANSEPLTLGAKNIGEDWYTGDMDEVSLQIDTSTAPPPAITGFSPSSGPVGSSVMINGSGFTGATGVRFNEVSATTFNVVSSTEITATVPAGATTGTIKVTTPVDSATSTSNFTVSTSHARSVTLKLRKHPVARGVVSASDGFMACVLNVPVKIQRRVSGHWKTVGSTTTTPTGSYKERIPDKPGKYRVKAPKVTLNAGADICSAATSPLRTNS